MDSTKIIDAFRNSGKQVLIILGPTGSGKSGLGIEIAKEINGEIISADSRQIYRGMDIGTGKVTKDEMCGVPHHLLDVVNPHETFTVFDYKEKVLEVIANILARGKVPIVVGGTGLYIQTLVQNFTLGAIPSDEKVRQELQKELIEKGEDTMWEELENVDPNVAHATDRRNHRYLLRALEIWRLTGKTKSELSCREETPSKFSYFIVGIEVDPNLLKERIEKRHRAMFEDNALIVETKALLDAGNTFGMESMSSIGYSEVGRYLRNEITREEAIELTVIAARQYAKRQRTWFRRMEKEVPILWITF